MLETLAQTRPHAIAIAGSDDGKRRASIVQDMLGVHILGPVENIEMLSRAIS